jgi:hypothetical protein
MSHGNGVKHNNLVDRCGGNTKGEGPIQDEQIDRYRHFLLWKFLSRQQTDEIEAATARGWAKRYLVNNMLYYSGSRRP